MILPVEPAAFLPFLIAVILVEATPGPNMGYLAALSATEGRLSGFRAVAGVTLGLSVYMIAAVIGVAEIISRLPVVYGLLRWAGVIFLLYLAWDAWREADDPAADTSEDAFASPFWRGFLANILNPKAAIFYVSLLPGFMNAERSALWLQALILGSLHILVSIIIHTGIVIGAAHAGAMLEESPAKTLFRRAMAVLIAVIALWLAWETRQTG